jgi:hypothetical protein
MVIRKLWAPILAMSAVQPSLAANGSLGMAAPIVADGKLTPGSSSRTAVTAAVLASGMAGSATGSLIGATGISGSGNAEAYATSHKRETQRRLVFDRSPEAALLMALGFIPPIPGLPLLRDREEEASPAVCLLDGEVCERR